MSELVKSDIEVELLESDESLRTQPVSKPITTFSSLTEVQVEDVGYINDCLAMLKAAVEGEADPGDTTKIVNTMLKVLAERRKLLLLGYGASVSDSGDDAYDALEDDDFGYMPQ